MILQDIPIGLPWLQLNLILLRQENLLKRLVVNYVRRLLA